jgi:DNA-binding transcriptional LysR family regulator
MDRLTAMRVFADVAQTGSFTTSADRLEMSRAMVTRYVGEMETWLGARLLQRTTRRISVTDAGEQALRYSLQMLELAKDVEQDVAPADGVLRGQLRVTCSMSFAQAHLAAAISDFLARHPHLKVDLVVGDAAFNLVEARIDLAIRISNDPTPSLIARRIATCASLLVAAPAYLKRHGTPQHPADLAQHRCLGYANFGRSTWRLTRGKDVQEITVPTRFTANEATVLMQAAVAGGGIAIQPTYLAHAAIARGELVPVLRAWQIPDLAVNALYPSRRNLPPAVRALLDFLAERFAAARW